MKQRKSAGKHLDCIFCEIQPGHAQFVEEYDNFYLIKNLFRYSHWDGQEVEEHLMLIPKDHTDTLSTLPDHAAIEYFRHVTELEDRGYHIYARARGAVSKTIVHQHTHLIKPTGKLHKTVLYNEKPYIRIAL